LTVEQLHSGRIHRAIDRPEVEPPLTERAAIAARAELRGDRTGILGAIGPARLPSLTRARRVPESWSLVHVMERLEEAFRTLARLPMATRPRGYINSMPTYLSVPHAAGLELPPEILTERTPDGGLLMIAAEERLDPTDPEHLSRARILTETMIARIAYSFTKR